METNDIKKQIRREAQLERQEKVNKIHAPTDGFIFSVGVIIKPFGNEDDD